MIIAIDPGTHESAILQWDGERISNPMIVANNAIVNALQIVPPQTDLCIEMVACYGMAVGKEVFETCVWIGRFDAVWTMTTGKAASLLFRQQVKLHHCNSARAKDANVRQALIDRLGAPGTKAQPGVTYGIKSHLWSALAIAVYAFDTKNKRGVTETILP
jgi:hypothetical protein